MTTSAVPQHGQRLAVPGALLAAAVAAGIVLWLVGDIAIAAGFLGAGVLIAAAALVLRRATSDDAARGEPDWTVARAVAEAVSGALAITDRSGRLVCANDRYRERFDGYPTPPGVSGDATTVAALTEAGRTAWREGQATLRSPAVTVTRAGSDGEILLWHFRETTAEVVGVGDLVGAAGTALTEAGVMAAIVEADATVRSANSLLAERSGAVAGAPLGELLIVENGTVRLAAEPEGAALTMTERPLGEDEAAGVLVLLTPSERAGSVAAETSGDVTPLIGAFPFGLALVDREARFVTMNAAFAASVGTTPENPPLYPADLVVSEDKAALSDAVRRMAGGKAASAEVVIRLSRHPEEPVQLSLSPARGLAGAAVLLSLKDNGEESRLKREVAQATKMQAVGQLAGGVAHDFNNILTAIIGHCDLMLMRHSPGDSDYDDIGQVKANATRAASLTRQLLAFSRQQTLRPQVLQLADVVSEVSNLLKRLLGETVVLEVKHGRDVGAVRADPGQMEQVVVNLAVNARDAMLANGKAGRLTIQTRTVSIAEIRQRGTDIMPVGAYTALEVTDTGTGIPSDVLPKIFEPFFTTKEVGKGTGLGLSTVYGIVKQSGGYIFADSPPGEGATFTIYFPVHALGPEDAAAKPKPRVRSTDTWGTGTILLVEDEAMVRAVAERALARQGYTVLTAENGEAALELMQGVDPPTLVVTDVMMPVMDGPALARALRRRHPALPILFMSGYAEEQLRRSIDLDNVAFLPKPFSVQQLAEAARDILAQQEPA